MHEQNGGLAAVIFFETEEKSLDMGDQGGRVIEAFGAEPGIKELIVKRRIEIAGGPYPDLDTKIGFAGFFKIQT